MFKLSKTTDYGIVLLAQLAQSPSAEPKNARELAACSDLPVPMVSKILKVLAKDGLLVSHRGSKGGYHLARDPAELTVAEMIRVLEGPVGLTECAIGPALCEHETMCAVREPWQLISRVVEGALENVTLADLVRGTPSPAFDQVRKILQIEGRAEASPLGPETTNSLEPTRSPELEAESQLNSNSNLSLRTRANHLL